MFTGIIEERGTIRSVSHGTSFSRLAVRAVKVLEGLKTGDSISVNGVCLTVTEFGPGGFMADTMPETLRRTNLGELKSGSRVNLERALRLSDRIGGHLVTGHIDGTGKIASRWEEGNALWLKVTAGPDIMRYLADKGSVALDGVSLTISSSDARSFSVSVIPHTKEMTTLPGKGVGDPVNIECDLLAKYTEKLMKAGSPGSRIDMDFLARNDFL
jgi:riboflavin synthase